MRQASNKRVLLITPPLTQLNSPYPASPFLAGFLRSKGVTVAQEDLSLGLILELFSAKGLRLVAREMASKKRLGGAARHFLLNEKMISRFIGPVTTFLQGRREVPRWLLDGRSLPRGARFEPLHIYPELKMRFEELSETDQAKYVASLFLDEIADAIREGIDPEFGFSRYGERLAASQASFDPLSKRLEARKKNLIDKMIERLTVSALRRHRPDLVGITVPFSGNVYGALRVARAIGQERRAPPIVLGGGYVNTELRSLSDPRIFRYVNYITLDSGEEPLERILQHIKEGERSRKGLIRTFFLENEKVIYSGEPARNGPDAFVISTPSYKGLPLNRYMDLVESLNPVTRLWSSGRWNKLLLAHGCYWKRCTFCDTSLDYIRRYKPASVDTIIDQMESLMRETQWDSFHFVDEAAPPALLGHLSSRILERGLRVRWWGNIRFERAFTPELAIKMARAGCIAVTGGLEVASDRILKLIDKGVTVSQVARASSALASAGILVHTYLMYGFPSQTTQETVDSLEVVRQLFKEGCVQSAFWHRLAVTAHSPIGQDPEKFGISLPRQPLPRKGLFARNDLPYLDPVETPHDELGEGLRRATYNYMQGVGLRAPVDSWFGIPVPKASLSSNLVRKAIALG